MHYLKPSHGGELINLLTAPERVFELQAASRDRRSWDLTPRQLRERELLLKGGFSPLRGFRSRADYEGVYRKMRSSLTFNNRSTLLPGLVASGSLLRGAKPFLEGYVREGASSAATRARSER
jgi:hypothetical protein